MGKNIETALDALNLLMILKVDYPRATLFHGLVAIAKELHGLSEFDATEYVSEQLQEIRTDKN